MPRALPLVPSVADYTFGSAIDGVQYGFRVRWNARDAAWYLDVARQDGTPIASGLKIVLGANLGCASTDPFFQKYMLTPVDLSNAGRDATYDDLGTRVVVVVMSVTDALYNTNA
jgi:hypothetical protein